MAQNLKKPTFMTKVRQELANLGDNLNINLKSPKVDRRGNMRIPTNMQSLRATD